MTDNFKHYNDFDDHDGKEGFWDVAKIILKLLVIVCAIGYIIAWIVTGDPLLALKDLAIISLILLFGSFGITFFVAAVAFLWCS